jgi:hypothetical protein
MLADKLHTNAHRLFPSFEEAESNLTNGAFNVSEPGPYRIVAVYCERLRWCPAREEAARAVK